MYLKILFLSLKNGMLFGLQGCPALACVCGWLLASLSAETKQTFLNKHGHQVTKWTLEHLEALIDTTLSCGQVDSLATAFKILQPVSFTIFFFYTLIIQKYLFF